MFEKLFSLFKKPKRVDMGGFYLQAFYDWHLKLYVSDNKMFITHKSFMISNTKPSFSHFRNNCSIKKDLRNDFICSQFYNSFSRL